MIPLPTGIDDLPSSLMKRLQENHLENQRAPKTLQFILD